MADEKVKAGSLVTVKAKNEDKIFITHVEDDGTLQSKNALVSDIRNLAESLEDSEDKAINIKIAKEIVKKVTDLANEVDTSFETVNQNFTNVNNAISQNSNSIETTNQNVTAHEEDSDLHVTAEKQQKWNAYEQSIEEVNASLNALANDKAGVVKGIWTPLLSGSSGECTYEKQEGHYIKIDDLVICTFNLKIATVNTLAGYLAIKGFPFTPVKNAPLLTGAINNIKTTAQLPIGGTLEIDGSCYLKHNALNTFSSALSGTDISDGFDMVCCQVIYRM